LTVWWSEASEPKSRTVTQSEKPSSQKKVKNDFFADFDLDEEEHDEPETKESFQEKMSTSRLQYSEEEEKPNGKKNSTTKEFKQPSAPKPNIGSDSFVPTRSKVQVA